MDVLSHFIFLRIIIILKVAFPFSLWILLPKEIQQILFSSLPLSFAFLKYLPGLLIVSSFLHEIP